MNGTAAIVTGTAIWADAIAARAVLQTHDGVVYVLDRPIPIACAFRLHFGVPCPTCGISRALALSLHGNFAQAWPLFPAAPMALFGALGFGAVLLLIGLAQTAGRPAAGLASATRNAAFAYSICTLIVWLAGWMANVTLALL